MSYTHTHTHTMPSGKWEVGGKDACCIHHADRKLMNLIAKLWIYTENNIAMDNVYIMLVMSSLILQKVPHARQQHSTLTKDLCWKSRPLTSKFSDGPSSTRRRWSWPLSRWANISPTMLSIVFWCSLYVYVTLASFPGLYLLHSQAPLFWTQFQYRGAWEWD